MHILMPRRHCEGELNRAVELHKQHEDFVILAVYITTSKFIFAQHRSHRTQFCCHFVNRCFTWHCTVTIRSTAFAGDLCVGEVPCFI